MTKRELRLAFRAEDFADTASPAHRLRVAITDWAKNRQEEGRPLELMLFIHLPGHFNARVDDLVQEVLFNTPQIHSLLLGQVVSVSIRSDELQMPIRGVTFVVE
jgi:hypothetical protein